MRKAFLLLFGAALTLLMPSCVEFETEVSLNKDGSGTISENIVFGPQAVGMLEMAAAQGGEKSNPLVDLKDEAKLKEKAKEYGEGVTFLKVEPISRNDGSKGARVTYQFTDINKVKLNPAGGLGELAELDPKMEKAAGKAESAKFTYAEGVLKIDLPQPEKAEEKEDAEAAEIDPNDPQLAMMTQFFKGMKMSAKLTLPGGIAETNASFVKDHTITMIEMEMDQVLMNPEGMAALSKLNGGDPKAAAAAMAKIDGVKAETQKQVTVTLK